MLNIIQNDLISWRYEGIYQGYFKEERPFYPSLGENIVEDSVDLSWSSPLRFNAPKHEEFILWQLDLGLREAPLPLNDEGQFAAQVRALQEFIQKLYLPMEKRTFGLSLYKGPLSFPERELFLDYFKLMTAYLPEGVPLFLMLEGSSLSEAEFLMLTSKEQFFPFHLILSHPLLKRIPYSMDVIGWGVPTVMGKAYSSAPSLPSIPLPTAFLLPHSSCEKQLWECLTLYLDQIEKMHARLIPEALLTEMWEGVEELYYLEEAITSQGRRKLAGFAAAGGVLHAIKS